MHSDRWNQVKDIFAAALERHADERSAFVNEACDGDEELRAEVNSLLAAHDTADDFIAQPAAEHAGVLKERPEKNWIGCRLGVYRIIDEAGRGGMSQVFKAVRDDDHYEKQVAVKLLRPGLDTDSVLRRFKSERQILAKLSHPNIAHLIDGGATDDGAPYLVMEYVEGKAIDKYCEELQLGLDERLDLFRDLCSAVHYVHQHLMVHGDLKGGNVLVTKSGVVKLLDFGIAKLLGPTPALTGDEKAATTFLALTPEYASPEQVRGEPITTASDVYSLGVLLYRLLAGALPHRATGSSTWELAKDICEHVARPPSDTAASLGTPYSTFAKSLRGDLDNVVLKALKKEPAERYGSAEQLADDLRRYLRGFPVAARPDTTRYRVMKFVRRHRAATVAASMFAVSLVAGIAATTWQAYVASVERARAERHFNEIRELTSIYLQDVYDSIADLPGGTTARKLLVENSIKYLSSLERESQQSPELQRDLARAYERLGDVQGDYIGANIGDTQGAVDNYRRSLNIRRTLAQKHPSVEASRDLIRSCVMLSEILMGQSATSESIQLAREGAQIADQLLREGHRTAEDLYYAGSAFINVGWQEGLLGDIEIGMKSMTRARDLFEEWSELKPDDLQARRSLALVSARIGNVYLESANPQPAKALPYYEESLRLVEPLAAEHPLDADIQRARAFVLTTIGEAQTYLGQAKDALSKHDRALEVIERLRAADEADRLAPLAIAFISNNRGRSYLALGEHDAALRDFSRSETIVRNAPPSQPTDITEIRLLPGMTYANLAAVMSALATHESTPERLRHNYAREAQEWSARAIGALQTMVADPVEGPRAERIIAQVNQAIAALP